MCLMFLSDIAHTVLSVPGLPSLLTVVCTRLQARRPHSPAIAVAQMPSNITAVRRILVFAIVPAPVRNFDHL